MTEASLKRDRDDSNGKDVNGASHTVSVEAEPQADVEDDDMVGPMLPPQPKKRKVCEIAAGTNIIAMRTLPTKGPIAGAGARSGLLGCTPQCTNV